MKAITGLKIFGWNYHSINACNERVRKIVKRFEDSKVEKFKKAAEMLEKESMELSDAMHTIKNIKNAKILTRYNNCGYYVYTIVGEIKEAIDVLEKFGLIVEIVDVVEHIFHLYEGASYSALARDAGGAAAQKRAEAYMDFIEKYTGTREISSSTVRKTAAEYTAKKIFGKKLLEE